jgi:hypothetical protein
MVQSSKLTKNEIKKTGFNNRSIADKFMKTVLNKKFRDIKKKEDLIKALKQEYTKMKNFGIDLNENAKAERKFKKIEKTNTKAKGELETLRKDRKDIDEALTELDVNQYLKEIAHYKLPTNKNFKDGAKKLKQLYYYKWEGIEDVLQTIKNLYNQQQTVFKFNISFTYLLVSTVRNEYKYMSAQYNNRLFEFPKTIEINKTLQEILTETEAKINNYKADRPNTMWKFYKFLHYEISVFRLQSTIATYIHPEQKDYRRLETPTKELYSNFYGKKYEVSYEGVKYLEYRKFADADIDEFLIFTQT